MMEYLYLLLNLGSISIPFIYSFHPKLKFYKLWRPLALALILTMCIYIPWDIIFTHNGFWGFNKAYLVGIEILNLPIEEWLFFICIPYACVFTHYALLYYLPNLSLTRKTTKLLATLLLLILLILCISNHTKWYSFVNFGYGLILTLIVLRFRIALLQNYFVTFLVMLVPFFIVNGILTGSFIDNEIVWYNNDENLGIRLFTIPVEDTIYAFTLILTNLFTLQLFNENLFQKKLVN